MLVALAHDTALALFDLRGEPRHVEMVERLEAKLNVDAGAHRIARSKKNADLAGIEIVEETLLCLRLLAVLHIGDLGRRHAEPDQFVPDPAIGRKAARGFDRQRPKVREDELAGAGLLEGSAIPAPIGGAVRLLPDPESIADQRVELVALLVILLGVDEAQVDRSMPAV